MSGVQLKNRDWRVAVRGLLRDDDDTRKPIEIGKEEGVERKKKVDQVMSS